MIYPNNFEIKIGFDKIREMLKERCLSARGEYYASAMRFTYKHDLVLRMLTQTNEFRQILLMESTFPARNFFDLTEVIKHLQLEGTTINEEELFDMSSSLQSIFQIRKFIHQRADKYQELKNLDAMVYLEESILQEFTAIIDDKGRIKDDASEKLYTIRKSLLKLGASIRNKIQRTLREAKKMGWANEDAEVTIRNGRAVIPLHAANKRSVKGFVHDESRTGQYVYLEPMELFETNNEIRELELAERQEIARILLDFSKMLREHSEELLDAYKYMGIIDFIRAKAKLALEMEAVKPVLNQSQSFVWREARHPLLYFAHKEKQKEVVPLDVALNAEQRILVISGPNAGGKSVCLKTVGILQYMLQCGLLIPLRENSEVGLFQNLFIDIGDEQSIENDLSTYSSHLLNIRNFVKYANAKSLFLIDEFGTGTEPAIGGAIAEAALEELNRKKAYGVITTHYSNLKAMATPDNGMVNAAMMFDTKELKPLYRLKIGRPGSSFAFEIARKIGLDEKLLNRARKKSGRKEIDFDQRLQELELEKEAVTKKTRELRATDEALSSLVSKYETLKYQLDTEKRAIINQAKKEAKEILKGANRSIEHAVKEIRESGADKVKLKEVRQEIEQKKSSLQIKKQKEERPTKLVTSTKEDKKREDDVDVLTDAPNVGDSVRVIGQTTVGKLEQVKGKNALVSFDSLRVSVAYAKLEKVKVQKQAIKSTRQKEYGRIMRDIHERSLHFKPNVDLRGKRAEEVMSFMQSWVDEALLIGVKELEVLHGTGNGILRSIIRDYLSSIDEVQSFKDARVDRGGAGKTLILLR
ncbi:MAG: Smr/MutS family protein [Bacteroidales bacterium]|nr:Smr/MutS family protein [Bacteroidales bacterium]